MLDGEQDLTDELLDGALVEAPPDADDLHEVPSAAQLGDEVVRVLRFHHLEQLHDVAVSHRRQQLALAPQVLAHVRVLLRLLLVHHLDRDLNKQVCFGHIILYKNLITKQFIFAVVASAEKSWSQILPNGLWTQRFSRTL